MLSPAREDNSSVHVARRIARTCTFFTELRVIPMTMASTRAQAVAEILWELKRAEKLATLTAIAERAGFSPGSDGRSAITCLKTVRRDWPHLQWWRAVADDGILDKEQKSHLIQAGFETETVNGDNVVVKSLADQLMTWDESDNPQNVEDSK